MTIVGSVEVKTGRFVGRAQELETLSETLAAVGPGPARSAGVAGDPGIGKTTLLGALGAAAREAGWVVLSGRATEFERSVPFGVFVDALDDRVAATLEEDESGLASLLGAVLPSVAGPGDRGRDVQDFERYRVHRALRRLLEILSERSGLVLLLDDLHWADESSVELIDHLLRHPPQARLLMVLSYRPRQAPPRLADALSRATGPDGAVFVELGPLPPEAMDELLDPAIAPADRRTLYRKSLGNPFYLEALTRGPALAREGGRPGVGVPTRVGAVLAAELAALPETERLVAWAAAVAGDSFVPDLVAEIAELPLASVLLALDGLVRRDLVRPDEVAGRFRFRHPLLRATAYEAAGAGSRIAAHRRAAEVLRAQGAPASELAHHVERSAAPGDRAAASTLLEAAVATQHVAPATATHWLRAALRLLPDEPAEVPIRLQLLGMLARTLGVTGSLAESRDVLHELLRLQAAAPATERARLVAFCAVVERLLGRHAEARALLLAELDALAARPDDGDVAEAEAVLKLELASGSLLLGDFTRDLVWAEDVLALARRRGDQGFRAAALCVRVQAAFTRGVLDVETSALLDEAAVLIDALPDGELARYPEAAVGLGRSELNLERPWDAVRHLRRGLRVARATGQNHVVNYLLVSLGACYTVLGRLREGAECVDDALDAALLTGSAALHGLALTYRSWIHLWCGELDDARRLAVEAVTAAGEGPGWHRAIAGAMLAHVHLYAGQPQECVRIMLEACGGPELPLVDPVGRPTWFQVLAAAEAARGRSAEALAWADRATEAASAMGIPLRTAFAELAYAYALLPTDPGAALPRALAAADSFREAHDPVEAARAELAAGTALGALGDLDHARVRFRRAKAEFEACGARLFLDQARREERRANARAPRRQAGSASRQRDIASGGVLGKMAEQHGLTAREVAVAELVASGLRNSEIAGRLYISTKTVETHLSRLFAKLGVSSRSAVASAFTRQAKGFDG